MPAKSATASPPPTAQPAERSELGRFSRGNKARKGLEPHPIIRTPEAKLAIQAAIFETPIADMKRWEDEPDKITIWQRMLIGLAEDLKAEEPEPRSNARKLVVAYGVGLPIKHVEINKTVTQTTLDIRITAAEKAHLAAQISLPPPGAKRKQAVAEGEDHE